MADSDADFVIKQGALGPTLDCILKGADGTAQDLTGATVTFSMESENGQIKVSAQAVTVLVAATGSVRYAWQSGDTDTAGRYRGEFTVTGLAASPVVFPSGESDAHPTGYIEIEVQEAVA